MSYQILYKNDLLFPEKYNNTQRSLINLIFPNENHFDDKKTNDNIISRAFNHILCFSTTHVSYRHDREH